MQQLLDFVFVFKFGAGYLAGFVTGAILMFAALERRK